MGSTRGAWNPSFFARKYQTLKVVDRISPDMRPRSGHATESRPRRTSIWNSSTKTVESMQIRFDDGVLPNHDRETLNAHRHWSRPPSRIHGKTVDAPQQCRRCKSGLLHPQCLEHRISRIGLEARLELGEQRRGNRGDVLHARHCQQQTHCSSILGISCSETKHRSRTLQSGTRLRPKDRFG